MKSERVDRMQGGRRRRTVRGAGGFAVRIIVFEAELTDHTVQVRGEAGELAEGLNGFFGSLGVLGGELGDARCGFGDFAGGSRLLGSR